MAHPLPTIETDHLMLRSFTSHDASQVYAYASNPCVAHYTHWQRHASLKDTHAFIATKPAQNIIWGIEHKETKTIIGECGFAHINYPTAEIYYALGQAWWGMGFAGQAVEAIL